MRADGRAAPDTTMLILTLLALSVGVFMVLSASGARAYDMGRSPEYFIRRQLVFAVSGIALMLAVSRIPLRFFRRYALWGLGVSVVLIALVLLVGAEENGARRWLDLGVTTFQPSELTNLTLILSFAAISCSLRKKMSTFRLGFLPFAGILLVIGLLLYGEPHLSAALIIVCIGAVMMFVGGTRPVYVIALVVLTAAVFWLIAVKSGYAGNRILVWRDPFSYAEGDGYRIVQSLHSLGSGGMLGTGLGKGMQSYLYLPDEHNDYLFSVVCEETGLIGAALILILFAVLILRGFWIAMRCRDRFGSQAAAGISALLAVQVFVNVAIVTNLVPLTGVSMPFFTYGGTALWLQLAEIGIILAASREIPAVQER